MLKARRVAASERVAKGGVVVACMFARGRLVSKARVKAAEVGRPDQNCSGSREKHYKSLELFLSPRESSRFSGREKGRKGERVTEGMRGSGLDSFGRFRPQQEGPWPWFVWKVCPLQEEHKPWLVGP